MRNEGTLGCAGYTRDDVGNTKREDRKKRGFFHISELGREFPKKFQNFKAKKEKLTIEEILREIGYFNCILKRRPELQKVEFSTERLNERSCFGI